MAVKKYNNELVAIDRQDLEFPLPYHSTAYYSTEMGTFYVLY